MNVPLPIEAVLAELRAALSSGTAAVLVAPPGAGKTTRVPLALMDDAWASTAKLILLEPRRLAARAAAERMAQSLGERVGETIGLRARFDTRVSARTRIEVVTEGVFTRMILDDPGLDGVAAVIFDEYHERSLDADLGLALALDAQAGLREDLRILVMSATLDGARVASLLGDAPIIESQGRAFPITTTYLGRDPTERLDDAVTKAILRAIGDETGSVLAFLPGQGEILRVVERLDERLRDRSIVIAPLFGTMDRAAQDRAIARPAPGIRKIVLATSIAETSLTIEGVRVVVDSGMARTPRFEPDLGMTRLETIRVSRAGADQRRGRAGRTEPGVCYRLWEEAATGALTAFATPEIRNADLSGLLLDLALWGARDPLALAWLDPPPAPALREARTLLRALDAIDPEGGITPWGRGMAALAAPPRIARMVVEAARRGATALGAEVATLLVEHALGGGGTDVSDRLDGWRRDRSARAEAARGLSRSFRQQADAALKAAALPRSPGEPPSPGMVLALAFPDRIAKARGRDGEFLMANGRAAALDAHDRLAREPWLAVGELAGRAGGARILLAAPLTLEEIETLAGDALEKRDELSFDPARAGLARRAVTRFKGLLLSDRTLPVDADSMSAEALAIGIATLGIARLPWTKPLTQWRDRVMFLRRAEPDPDVWPDLSDAALAETAATWLAPFILGKSSLAAVTASDLGHALQALLPYALQQRLDHDAPTHFEAPTGSCVAVDYDAEGGPALAIRVQELFGMTEHPALARGRMPLTLHLLSPAHRPIQITRDLPGFWRGSWAAVKAEMKGRYPRHPWPDDPAHAPPTTRVKPRG
ncbi:ATP-dependent helicase HrpB [Lichenihabitans psoromatis]|uniref:ATP-dependent helicase HrpB n=1 Tax=Lichenihabitans psoromatis TaxID=2528642 RepID=UPI0010383F12|nr:ATP-dependent helicase HrpB [Lichenihabitans psoromatis]